MKQEKVKSRAEKAREQALDYMDYIIEVREAPDFIEILGNMGGDDVTYRFWNNGMVTQR